MQPAKNITLYGATGFTGTLIAEAFQNAGISFLAAGRDLEKLQALKENFPACQGVFLADAENENQLERMLDQTKILVNCVGPFNLYSNLILHLAAARGIVYLDITGEQEFVRISREKYHQVAFQNGATLVHSVAFESFLADLMAAELTKAGENFREISSYYYFKDSRPSAGTRLTMQLARHYPTYAYQNGKLQEMAPLLQEKAVNFPDLPTCGKALFMPYPEVLFFSDRYTVANAGSYLLMPETEAIFARSQPDATRKTPEEILKRHARTNFSGPAAEERKKQHFKLLTEVIPDEGISRNILLQGADGYGLTASLITETVKFCQQAATLPTGFISPAQLVSATGFLEHISLQNGLEIQRNVPFTTHHSNREKYASAV